MGNNFSVCADENNSSQCLIKYWGHVQLCFQHGNENPIYVFLSGNWAASVPSSTFMCLWTIYIFPGHIFSCSRIGRQIMGIYKSLTDTWVWKLGLTPHNSFSGNICFEFSVLCLCTEPIVSQWAAGNDDKWRGPPYNAAMRVWNNKNKIYKKDKNL